MTNHLFCGQIIAVQTLDAEGKQVDIPALVTKVIDDASGVCEVVTFQPQRLTKHDRSGEGMNSWRHLWERQGLLQVA
jgi:hypothetical protein